MNELDIDSIYSSLNNIKYLNNEDYNCPQDFVLECYERSRKLNEYCRNFILNCMREVGRHEDF